MSTDFKEYKAAFLEQNDLAHFGILGMKWGVRRYQNKDGSLTDEGKRRKNLSDKQAYKEYLADKEEIDRKYGKAAVGTFIGATGLGIVGGLTARAFAPPSIPARVGSYFGARIAAYAVALPILYILSKNGDKTLEQVKRSYGKDRIEKMEKMSKQKLKNIPSSTFSNENKDKIKKEMADAYLKAEKVRRRSSLIYSPAPGSFA